MVLSNDNQSEFNDPQLDSLTADSTNVDTKTQSLITDDTNFQSPTKDIRYHGQPPLEKLIRPVFDELRQRIASDAKGIQSGIRLLRDVIHSLLNFVLHRIWGSQLVHDYRWALIPFVAIGVLQVNAHTYDTFLGYDMPFHFGNMYSVLTTGAMPPPPAVVAQYYVGPNYESYQAPLFYYLTAGIARLGESLGLNGYETFVKAASWLASMIWLVAVIIFVQHIMRRAHSLLRALTACIVMLLPAVVIASTMFSNDLPITICATLAIIQLWYMARSGRHLDVRLWLRSALFVGLSVAFKTSGIILIAVYSGWAMCVVMGHVIKHRPKLALKAIGVAGLGVPLIIVPFAINVMHASQYTTEPLGMSVQIPIDAPWGNGRLFGFMTGFDDTVFTVPVFNDRVGYNTYWSMQFVTLFADKYNRWGRASNAYPHAAADKLDHSAATVRWAIPAALIMIFGFLMALYRTVRWPRRAMHDGSIIIVLMTVAAQAGFIQLMNRYQNILYSIHARFVLFSYPILLIIGIYWLWRLGHNDPGIIVPATRLAIWGLLVGFCVSAYLLMWLPV